MKMKLKKKEKNLILLFEIAQCGNQCQEINNTLQT